jgi:hypothetical protein
MRRLARMDPEDLAWYVAYGSNLRLVRFRCYLAGGCPHGARRTYEGCRNPADPVAVAPVTIPGRLLFAGESRVWTGGIAFYDPDGTGKVAGRAYLLTRGQFDDVAAQENRYDVVVHVGAREGHPMLTITSNAVPSPAAPAATYLWSITDGLREAHGWDAPRIAEYLAAAPGLAGAWTRQEVTELANEERSTER